VHELALWQGAARSAARASLRNAVLRQRLRGRVPARRAAGLVMSAVHVAALPHSASLRQGLLGRVLGRRMLARTRWHDIRYFSSGAVLRQGFAQRRAGALRGWQARCVKSQRRR
jgi:hypothetical protein